MNKFYYLLLTAFVLFFGYGIITKKSNDSIKKERRVPCQERTTTFEKISNKNLATEAIKLFESGNFTIKSRIEQSIYMQSKILNYIDSKKADEILLEKIKPYQKEQISNNKKLLIDYYILENDKEDKGKKSPKSKIFAGYLVFEFILDDKLIYKIQSDYMKIDTSDIPERMACVIKSFITLKETK
ncbi:hypothetical protein [Halarcobacter ebronensis]|uniref:Uncharacterized protein n=1 Tax=Halarcobacter ebronensis TaxID=1462615 RepID=A0A4Q1ADU5_9BACT|nr:hypothetical protein [Halarcobacter ebronensis]QKF81824.1 hypothetical protein AEBR_1333 [Halarcobacter ebronensis]RXK01577.1 hypothetical protein CRV07_14970 [Halarcobacter ebronensis]